MAIHNINVIGRHVLKYSNSISKSNRAHYCSTKWIAPLGYDTGIRIYNCVEKGTVPLILRNEQLATWYTCGPTVYDSAHIGHASCYVKFDIIQRILKSHFKIRIATVMGMTDIDDKIIKRSVELNEAPKSITLRYEKEFWRDMDALGVCRPDVCTRVTEHISYIVSFIQKLIDINQAYRTPDGSVYFETAKYKAYGKLQNIALDKQALSSSDKSSSLDFALWKGAKPGEPSWETPWGAGRPGWHIECSAMASHSLGSVIDFHSGGIDLRFPHHENEEAQSCAYHGHRQWVNYWMHSGHLHLKGAEKMSKSLHNTISVAELLSTHSPRVFRMACVMSHYRKHMEFSSEIMDNAAAICKKYDSFFAACKAYVNGQKPNVAIHETDILNQMIKTVTSINKSLCDDFDTASCIKEITELVTLTNKMLNETCNTELPYTVARGPALVTCVSKLISEFLEMVGLEVNVETRTTEQEINTADLLKSVLQFRDSVRQAAIETKHSSLFELCDKIRNDLQDCGVDVKDHGKMSSWSINKT